MSSFEHCCKQFNTKRLEDNKITGKVKNNKHCDNDFQNLFSTSSILSDDVTNFNDDVTNFE